MSLTVNKVAQNGIFKKALIPAAIATLLSTTALKAQEPQQDTLMIEKKEVVNKTAKKEEKHVGDIILGTLFTITMGITALGGSHCKKDDFKDIIDL